MNIAFKWLIGLYETADIYLLIQNIVTEWWMYKSPK